MATILIVEDEATVLILVESVLKHAGYETLTASTLAEAQAIISSDQPLDLVFTDINLHNEAEGGILVGQLAHQTRPGIPVVYATARSITDGMQALLVEPSLFLTKPYTDERIIKAVSELLRDKNPPQT